MNRKILVITPALPYNQDDALYKLVAELKKKSIEVDLFSGVLPEHEKIIRYYPKSSLFSNIQKNLKKSLLNTSYEAVVFYTGDTVPVFFEKVKSFTPVKTILFNSKENVEEINDVKFDFKAGSIEDVLNFLSRDYNPPEKLTSIIMLTFNQLSLTGQCVRSLEKYTHAPYELIVIDNGSTDGTAEYLRRHENSKDNVRCVFNEENRAFSKANNQGIKIAKGDFILLLNNDVILTDKWLQRLITCAESMPNSGVVGPCANIASGPQKTLPGYNELSDLQKFAVGFNIKNSGRWIDCHRLNAFCLLIKREVIDRVGMLDERFGPGGFEDYDYCLRVRQAGFKVVLAGDTYIHHVGGQGYEPNKMNYNELRAVNKQIFINKWCRKALEIMETIPDG